MQYLSTDFLVIYFILGLIFVTGFRSGRGIKDIKGYATGNKTFVTGSLVLTFLATDISGGDAMLDIPHVFRTDGIIEILSIGGWLLAYLVQGFIFAPRFIHFPNCMTMGDVMKTLYKGPSQILTGILATATAICIAGMEVTVLGVLTEVLLGVDFIWGVALGGGLLVLYTVNGGMKAVTYTDILQFLIFIAIVPILASDALRFAGGKEAVMAALSASQRTILHHPKLGGMELFFYP